MWTLKTKLPDVTNHDGESIGTLINESGMYSLIFKRWVTKDVLPSIRKQGFYNSFNNRK